MVSQSQCRNDTISTCNISRFTRSLDCAEYFYLFFWPPDDRCHVPGFQCHRCNAQPTRATKRSPPTPREPPPISLPGLVPTFLDLAFCPSSSPRLALTSFPDPLLTRFLCRCKIIFVQTMQNSGSAVFSGGQVGWNATFSYSFRKHSRRCVCGNKLKQVQLWSWGLDSGEDHDLYTRFWKYLKRR